MNIAIIGSDSFIAERFIGYAQAKGWKLKLFTRIKTRGVNEHIVPDFFSLTSDDFEGCDTVINFAAIVHQPQLKDDALYRRINTDLPVFLAELAQKACAKQFIQMSTIAVYGKQDTISITIKESPQDIYGETKSNADQILQEMTDTQFKVAIVRPPMVYGGGNAPGNLMKLIRFAQNGIPLPFKGVNNARDFIHVDNLVACIGGLVDSTNAGVFLPKDKDSVSTETILNLVKANTSKTIRIIKVPHFVLQVIRLVSKDLYSKLYGSMKITSNVSSSVFVPEKSIEDGINEMLSVIDNNQEQVK